MRYDTKKEKQHSIEQLKVNIPVGTKFNEYIMGFKGRREISEGVVIGHTKSGNIKLQRNGGGVFKTKYHFQKLDKWSSFEVVGSCRVRVEFL
jgi:hypothetical protein